MTAYALRVTVNRRTHEVRPATPAPYYVLDHNPFDADDEPRLIGCTDIINARYLQKTTGCLIVNDRMEIVR